LYGIFFVVFVSFVVEQVFVISAAKEERKQ